MSYEFFKFSLLHKNGVNYEIHVNLPIFKKSKNGQKPHKFKNHLTSCFTKVQKLDLRWSDLKFKTFLSPAPSPLCYGEYCRHGPRTQTCYGQFLNIEIPIAPVQTNNCGTNCCCKYQKKPQSNII